MKFRQKTEKLEKVIVYSDDITCDKCHKKIDPDAWVGDRVGHELHVWLDPDQCVNFFRARDYCDDCYRPIWEAINILLHADPDEERDQDYDSR